MDAMADRARRLALSRCMVDILRPAGNADMHVTLNERLIGYAVAIGHYEGTPLGIHKISEMTGLARSTVRNVIKSVSKRGWIEPAPNKTFRFTTEFHEKADDWFGLELKYEAILRTAESLRNGHL